ncbi:MAG: hypothetical protein AABX01_07185 [Candidatus Micrarchaeota archaeon]
MAKEESDDAKEKSGSGGSIFGNRIFQVVIGLIIVVILFLGYMGFIPGLSDLMGSGPVNLGIKYTDADYQSAIAKVPGHVAKTTEFACFTCNYKSSGNVPVNNSFTDEELTALANHLNSKKGPLKNIQIRLNGDGSIEMSARGSDGLISTPVYVKAKIASTSIRWVNINLESANAGKIGVSSENAQKAAEGVLNELFKSNTGLSIESLTIEDGKINFKGTLPQEVVGDPNAVAQSVLN